MKLQIFLSTNDGTAFIFVIQKSNDIKKSSIRKKNIVIAVLIFFSVMFGLARTSNRSVTLSV